MEFQDKSIVVFGMGKSGFSAVKLLKHLGSRVKAISKGTPESWNNYDELKQLIGIENCISEKDAGKYFEDCELVILSPGISRKHPHIKRSLKKGISVIGEIEFGASFVNSPIIAVTGSNGKTTTTMIIEAMLNNAGISNFAGGNIGTPLCDHSLEIVEGKERPEIVVLELSSFQLESIVEFKPYVVVFLNIFQNHGERYDSIDDYAKAKFNISNNMSVLDHLIYFKECRKSSAWADTQKLKKHPIDKKYSLCNYNFDKFSLHGEHNLTNLKFVDKVREIFKIDSKHLQQTIDEFNGVPYRIEKMKDIRDEILCDVYNDSKSTNFSATVAATNCFKGPDKKVYLIIGGQKRGEGTNSILPYIDKIKAVCDKVFLIGETTDLLSKELDGKIDYLKSITVDQALETIIKEKFEGILLFSPAFPSFDQFKNYVKRGEYFKEQLR